MAQSLEELFRTKLAKLREESQARATAFPFFPSLSPSPEEAVPSTSSSQERRPLSSRTRKEPAPEVLEMRRQFNAIREQLRAQALAKTVRAEKQEKDRKERMEEAKEKEAEDKAKGKGKAREPPSQNTWRRGSGSGRPSELRQEPWYKQTPVPQVPKTPMANLVSKARFKFMTYKDKCELSQDLSQLPGEQLGGMICILLSREPTLCKVKENKMEVNLDYLKQSTLWELRDYVTSCVEKQQRAAAARAEAVAGTSAGQEDASLSGAESQSEWETPSSSDSDS